MKAPSSLVTAFAPASVANVAVGFDVLGFALDGVGDRVSVRIAPGQAKPIVVEQVSGLASDVPADPARNTASVALRAMIDDLRIEQPLAVQVEKGIPLGSGMGGSAASAVGAVVAADRLLGLGLDRARLLAYALVGESAASGAPHADNAAPCLHGGLTAVVSREPPLVVDLPVPSGIAWVVVHPRLRIETRAARAMLERHVSLGTFVEQSMRLAGFVAGCYRDEPGLVEASMVDLIAGPQRARLIPGFDDARQAAIEAGAFAFAISGSGPSVFAWVRADGTPGTVADEVSDAFRRRGLPAQSWTGMLGAPGARIVDGADRSACDS
jgi:homoserine kinase